MSINFGEKQVANRVRFENPWWETETIDAFYARMRNREYIHLMYPLLTDRSVKRALVLMGPRRVGKTVLLYHCIEKLIADGADPRNIVYFSIETPIYTGVALEELVQLYMRINKKSPSDELFVFFDEIQYLKDWERHLKSLVDSYHNIKFIVSGSAAAALKLKSQESGAGRFTEFILPPLTFYEFLTLTDNDNGLIDKHVEEGEDENGKFDYTYFTTSNISKLNELFFDYINYGGYPELSLSESMREDPGRYIRNDIIDKVLMRDLPSLYGIKDVQELNSLFNYLAYNSGNELSLDGISQNSGVAKNTIKKYISYLEAAYLIKVIHRVDQSAKKFQRANFFKVYLTNPSLRSALFSPVSQVDEFSGNMVETALFSQYQHHFYMKLYYARWGKGEVDIVHLDSQGKPDWCVEVKWSNRFVDNVNELKGLQKFCGQHNPKEIIVTTIDKEHAMIVNGSEFKFSPASISAYNIGRSILEVNRIVGLRNWE